MTKELDRVVLTVDLPEHGLVRGDVGTVVLLHGDEDPPELVQMKYGASPADQTVFCLLADMSHLGLAWNRSWLGMFAFP